ncbi:hypothetical protein Q8A73_017742 [Channa argus]|nr:hypothetical protein Q8A73_017742 [Channa argus]
MLHFPEVPGGGASARRAPIVLSGLKTKLSSILARSEHRRMERRSSKVEYGESRAQSKPQQVHSEQRQTFTFFAPGECLMDLSGLVFSRYDELNKEDGCRPTGRHLLTVVEGQGEEELSGPISATEHCGRAAVFAGVGQVFDPLCHH